MEKVHTTAARSGFPHQNVKTLHVRITFWKLRCSKSARRCGTKHMSKLKCANPSDPENFWKLRCWKSARRCGAKRISKSKLLKTVRFEALSVQKVHAVVARSTFPNQNVKTLHVRSIFGRSLVILCGRRKEFSTFQN